MNIYSFQKVKNIVTYWNEITKPQEQREQEIQEKASKALEDFKFDDTIKEGQEPIYDSDGNLVDLSEYTVVINPPNKQ